MPLWILGVVMLGYSLLCLRDGWVVLQDRKDKMLWVFSALRKDMLEPQNKRQALVVAGALSALSFTLGLYFILPHFRHLIR